MRRSLLAASALLAVTAFGDKTWSPAEGTVVNWQATAVEADGSTRFLCPYWMRNRADGWHVIVVPNAHVADVAVLSSQMNCGNWPTGGGKPYNKNCWGLALPYCETRTDTKVRWQMQWFLTSKWGAVSTYRLGLVLEQVGENVCAYVDEAGTYSSFAAIVGEDLESDEMRSWYKPAPTDVTNNSKNTNQGYGFDQLTLVVKNGSEESFGPTVYEVSSDLSEEQNLFVGTNVEVRIDVDKAYPSNVAANHVTLSPGSRLVFVDAPDGFDFQGEVVGQGGEIVYKSTATGTSSVVWEGCTSDVTVPISEGQKDNPYADFNLFTNLWLSTVTNATCKRECKNIRTDDVTVCHFVNNGNRAKCQAQYLEQGHLLRCVMMTLVQRGNIVSVKSSFKKLDTDEHPEKNAGVGYDFEENPDGFTIGALNLGRSLNDPDGRTCICDLRLFLDSPAATTSVSLTGTLSTTNTSIIAEGPVRFKSSLNYASYPICGRLVARQGGELLFGGKNWGEAGGYFNEHVGLVCAETGGRAVFTDPNALDFAWSYRADGGRLLVCANNTTSVELSMNNIFMKNGAALLGAGVHSSFNTGNPRLDVAGTGAVTVSHPYELRGNLDSGKIRNPVIFDVADTTEGIDLFLDGGLTETSTADNRHRRVEKRGVGTLRLGAPSAYCQETIVSNGVWLLGVNNAMNASQSLTLTGGALAAEAGTTNALGTLTLTSAGGALDLGENAQLSFTTADVAVPGSGVVNVISGVLQEKSLRIGTTRCLSDAQLKSFRYVKADTGKSRRVMQDAEGYITPIVPLVIIFR